MGRDEAGQLGKARSGGHDAILVAQGATQGCQPGVLLLQLHLNTSVRQLCGE